MKLSKESLPENLNRIIDLENTKIPDYNDSIELIHLRWLLGNSAQEIKELLDGEKAGDNRVTYRRNSVTYLD
jgi:hypothetical protein